MLGRLTTRAVGESQIDCSNQDGSVQSVHHQYTPVRQRNMDNIYAKQERKLNSCHMRSLRRILGIIWSDRVPNTQVIKRAGLPTMYTLLRQRRLRWLGHVRRMEDGRIPKDILYGELASGKRSVGRPQLRYKDVCKGDLKALDINIQCWEDMIADRNSWRSMLQRQLKAGEEQIQILAEEKRARRKARTSEADPATIHTCVRCGKVCLSRIGLSNHSRRCVSRGSTTASN